MEVIGVFDGMCYSASKEEQTDWLGAQRKCLDRGASLPIRMTETSRRGLQSALSAINTRKAFYWIGASSSVSDWRWADGEKIGDGADWPSEEPPIPGASEAVLLARPLDWRWVPASQSAWNAFLCHSKPKFCTSPGVGEATKVVFSSHSYAIGTYCFYACEEGYEMEGERQRQCEENGRWSGNIPTCHKRNCGEPEPWTQGTIRILNGSTLYQSEVEYVCFAGYQLLGDSKRVCQADGTWSGATPGCIELDCGRPSNVANGMVFVDSTTFESMANYTCNHGYRLIGPDAIFCGEKSVWEPSAPFCYDISSLREVKPEPGSSNTTTSESNILLALLAVLLVSLLVMAVFKFSRPGISGSASINEKYSSNVIYATPSVPTRPDSVVYYAASCQPLAQMEVPPHLLSLQQLPNGNIHVTLPIGRPLVRPALPTFAPVSPTPSQILYSFDHEPIYDIPPDGIEIKKEENYYEHMDNPISRSPMTSASGSQQALLPSGSPMPPPPPIRYFPT